MMNVKVLICGAGASGLVLAIDLARRGVPFRLIEKLDRPFSGSRGRGIQPRTLEIFEDLGIVDRIFAQGGAYPVQRIYEHDGIFRDEIRAVPVEPTTEEPYQHPVMIPQFKTEAILRERLSELGYKPEFATELISFAQDHAGVLATLKSARGEETFRVEYLIGCDGGRSFVRHHLAIDFPGKSFGVRVLAADIKMPALSRETGHEWNEGDMSAQLGIDPLQGTDLFCLRAPVPMDGEISTNLDAINDLIRLRARDESLVAQEVTWASVFTMGARLAATYQVGRVFLCGDAAHVHPPTGGQGLNTSVQDAYNLGWKLEHALTAGDDRILESYEEERRPIAEGMLGLSTKILEAEKSGGGKKRGREVLQLDLSYAGSSLALTEPAGRAGRVGGDRAPDAPFISASGHHQRLFDLFRGSHFTLLAYEPTVELLPIPRQKIFRIGPRGEIMDGEGAIARAYGLRKGDLALIRPDGYIGAVCPEASYHKLARLLI